MKTQQEIFDIAATHLLKQGEKSIVVTPDRGHGPTPTCRYRGAHGMKCAVGIFIGVEQYSIGMEGMSVDRMFGRYPEVMEASGLDIAHQEFLSALQKIHDQEDVAGWRHLLWSLALENGLDPQVTIGDGS